MTQPTRTPKQPRKQPRKTPGPSRNARRARRPHPTDDWFSLGTIARLKEK